MDSFLINEVEATLKHGKRMSKFAFQFFVALLVITAVFAIIVFSKLLNGDKYSAYYLTLNFFSMISLISILAAVVFLEWQQRRNVKKWMKDAEPLVGEMVILGKKIRGFKKVAKIMVTFEYEGKKIEKVSGGKRRSSGYHNVFLQMDGSDVRLMYSPSYNEVMILK